MWRFYVEVFRICVFFVRMDVNSKKLVGFFRFRGVCLFVFFVFMGCLRFRVYEVLFCFLLYRRLEIKSFYIGLEFEEGCFGGYFGILDESDLFICEVVKVIG